MASLMSRLILLSAVVYGLLTPGAATAALVYSENPEDFVTDLSDDHAAPTSLGTLPLGVGTVLGFIDMGTREDQDIFTFKVGTNHQLDSIHLLVEGDQKHFLGISAGTQISDSDASTMLLARLVNNSDRNDNLLTDVLTPEQDYGGSGISAPLGAGDYTIWLRENVQETFEYEFTFQTSIVTAIPEPSAAFFLGMVGTTLVFRRKRSR